MIITVSNKAKPHGCVSLPPSKSEAIRAALLYALAGEDPRMAVAGFPSPYCADIGNALGAAGNPKEAYVGQSAALLRFIIPIQMALYGRVSVRADEALLKRGLYEAEECLGISLAPKIGTTYIEAKATRYKRRYEIDCSRSSQFLSGLLIALPLLKHECEIVIKNGLVSKPYADMTLEFIRLFGGKIENTATGYRTYPSRYAAPKRTPVKGDRSLAAVFEAMNLFGGEVTVLGERDPLQPDSRFLMISSLPVIDVADCPDLLPILAASACGKAGETVITGTYRLKTKESDRPNGIVRMINDLGGSAETMEDRVIVHGSGWLRGGECDPLGDHRLAFAAAVMAMISENPVTLHGAECVSKSAPQFRDDLERIGSGLDR